MPLGSSNASLIHSPSDPRGVHLTRLERKGRCVAAGLAVQRGATDETATVIGLDYLGHASKVATSRDRLE